MRSSDWTSDVCSSDLLFSEVVSAAARVREPGPIVLRATGLTLTAGAEPIDFALRAGEIVGLAGLEGQGQDAFLRALWGLDDRAGSVERLTSAGVAPVGSPRAALHARLAFVPRVRRAQSLFGWRTIVAKFTPPTLATPDRQNAA